MTKYGRGGELTNAVRRLSNGDPVYGQTYAYFYDGIGNMTSGGPVVGGKPLYAFETGGHYLQTGRSWSNLVGVAGTATNAATVSVTMTPTGAIARAVRQGDRFHAWATVDNATGSVWAAAKVTAVLFDAAAFNDVIQEADGRLYVPQNVETVSCSANGYIVADSRWTYTFDPFNQLVEMVSRNLPTNTTLKFDYYPDGKRARKVVKQGSTTVQTNQFYYDRWNLIRETVSLASGTTITRKYLWGHDLAGWRSGQYDQEAGGIGGLLAISVATNTQAAVAYFPLTDGQGNIRHVVDGAGNVVATYDYDPFGTLIAESGSAKGVCPFRFSSKYYDNETGLLYFGYRFFDSRTAKWLSVDPLGIAGGVNLTAYCRNDPVNNVDPLGLEGKSLFQALFPVHAYMMGAEPMTGSLAQDVQIVHGGTYVALAPLTLPGKVITNPTVQRGMKVVGVSAEVVAGAAGFVGTSPTIAGSVVSGAAVVHGIDTVQSGIRGDSSYTAKGLTALTGNAVAGELLDAGLGVGLNFGAGMLRVPASSPSAVTHLTSASKAGAISQSQRFGGAYGLFAIEAGKVPESQFVRVLLTGRGDRSVPVLITGAATRSFRPPPMVGPVSIARNLAGVRSAPLGYVDLETRLFVPNVVLREGVFSQASRWDILMSRSHQVLVDYVPDAIIGAGRLTSGYLTGLETETAEGHVISGESR